ncbi:hypothetical protein [Lysobacter sp. D1-1-M9]|uniref:hypothetical protein n=1 Tax=Novilysobacter longmucuonensis TaxID=3098603 RepID=UPI002FC9ECB2
MPVGKARIDDRVATHEISAAALSVDDAVFNPQQQFAMTWPNAPVVAAAYVDQLSRSGTLEAGLESELRAALDAAQTALDQPASAVDKSALVRRLEALSKVVTSASDAGGRTSERQSALSAVLTDLAARLR